MKYYYLQITWKCYTGFAMKRYSPNQRVIATATKNGGGVAMCGLSTVGQHTGVSDLLM